MSLNNDVDVLLNLLFVYIADVKQDGTFFYSATVPLIMSDYLIGDRLPDASLWFNLIA